MAVGFLSAGSAHFSESGTPKSLDRLLLTGDGMASLTENVKGKCIAM
jgi:hypothetical protein